MSDFKAKMHQIRSISSSDDDADPIPSNIAPRSRWGADSAPTDPLGVFKGPTSIRGGRGRGRGGKGKEKERKGMEEEGRKERGRDLPDQYQTASYVPEL